MGAGAAGLPGARVMLLTRDPEPENATTPAPNWEGKTVRGRSSKRSTARFQSWRTSKGGRRGFFYFPLRKESEFYLFQHSVLVGVLVDLVLPISL